MIKFSTLLVFILSSNLFAFPELNLNTGICSTDAGMADSYVLAVSSQPGFCQTYGYEAGKPECTKLSPNSYQAHHLTLHGLWPNQDGCGQHYGFCGVKQRTSHCDYPRLNFVPAVAEQLKKIMPSYHYGSCLERHEWYKHGSCQMLSADDYFSLAMRLTTETDQTPFGEFLTKNSGETVQLSVLSALIRESFGARNVDKVSLGCKNGVLVDVLIQLPALIPFDEPLNALIDKAPASNNHSSCPKKVFVSNFTRESML